MTGKHDSLRRVIAALLALTCCLGVAGCGTRQDPEPTTIPAPSEQETQPTESVVDDGDTTAYEIRTEYVYLNLINALEDPICPNVDWTYSDVENKSTHVTVITKDIQSMGIYLADGTPVYAENNKLYYVDASGAWQPAGIVYSGGEGSNLYVLYNQAYRITRITAKTEDARIRVYYSHWDKFGMESRGMEFDNLQYGHKISIEPWIIGMTNETGIRINNGKEAAEKEYSDSFTVDWDSIRCEKETHDAYLGISNSKYAVYMEKDRQTAMSVKLHNIKSLGIYTAEGYPVYSVEDMLFYDDADGKTHYTGDISRDRDGCIYSLCNVGYRIGRIEAYDDQSWIQIHGKRMVYNPQYDQIITLPLRQEGMNYGDEVSVSVGDPSERKVYTDETRYSLINAKTVFYDDSGIFRERTVGISVKGIKSIGLFTAEGYPIYEDDWLLFYEDEDKVEHLVGTVETLSAKTNLGLYSYHYSLREGAYYIGMIEKEEDETAEIRAAYDNPGRMDSPVYFSDLNENSIITISSWMPNQLNVEGIVRDDNAPVECKKYTQAVAAGLANAKKEQGSDVIDIPELDTVEIQTDNIRNMALYMADGSPIYAVHDAGMVKYMLCYDDAQGRRQTVGTYRYRSENAYQISLNRGEYRIGWINAVNNNSSVRIGYCLKSAWTSNDPSVEFRNLREGDWILIRSWQPGMTNEDGILIQRGNS